MSTHFDIAIVGGGMAGTALAVALANTSLRIALIDAAPVSDVTDHRLIALTHASCDFLTSLNLWPLLSPHAAMIKAIHVSQKGRFGISRLHASDIHRDTLGHVIPAQFINTALHTQLASAKWITRLQPATVTALNQNTESVTLQIDSKGSTSHVSTRLVIAADGSHSTVRKLLTIPVETSPSSQKALVTLTHLARHHDNIAYERFHATGALAMLPLTGNRTATIWTDTSEKIVELLAQSDKQFIETLQTQMGYRLGRFLHCDARFSYPLQWMQVRPEHQKNGRVLLIGNAAHTLHPIAAQGLNLALQEIKSLAKQFSAMQPETLALPYDLDYIKQQKTRFQLSKDVTRLFTTDFFPVNVLKTLGLVALDLTPALRRRFLQRAT